MSREIFEPAARLLSVLLEGLAFAIDNNNTASARAADTKNISASRLPEGGFSGVDCCAEIFPLGVSGIAALLLTAANNGLSDETGALLACVTTIDVGTEVAKGGGGAATSTQARITSH